MRASSSLVLAAAALALAGCATKAPPDDPARMARLEDAYDRLHERLEKAAATEPLVASAFADRGQVVLAIRSGLIEELAGNVARRYLDEVTVDLSDVEGHSSGELRKKTFLGRIKLGEWSVSVELGDLVGRLRRSFSPRRPNEDLAAISKHVQVGLTPVIISPSVEWVETGAEQDTKQALHKPLEQWRSDWETRDIDRYLRHDSGKFSAGKQDLAAWTAQKRSVNAGKCWIKVKVDRVSMFLYPGNDDLAVVTFEQDYASSNVSNKMRKRQYWQREGSAWRVVYEGAA